MTPFSSFFAEKNSVDFGKIEQKIKEFVNKSHSAAVFLLHNVYNNNNHNNHNNNNDNHGRGGGGEGEERVCRDLGRMLGRVSDKIVSILRFFFSYLFLSFSPLFSSLLSLSPDINPLPFLHLSKKLCG